ncbi:MAG: DNA polymerase III subunit delta' [Actinomycetota bacterium]
MTVWDRLKGSRAADWLARQLADGAPAHAWLLIGPTGSGKRNAAVAMAAALNCTTTPKVGCGECSSCLRILRHRHPDVHHIVPEGPLIPVDIVRESVLPEAARSPFEGTYKVFVIEEADRMNEPAQNALLKTLEEPQPDTVFILISDHEEELLETVVSRCRVARLEAVPEERTVRLLTTEGVPESTALLAARVGDGDLARSRAFAIDEHTRQRRGVWQSMPRRLASPVDALDAAAEIIAEVAETVKAREGVQRSEVVELAEAMGEGRGTAAARNALAKRHRRELRRLEEEMLGEALQTLAGFYRDVLVFRRGGVDAVANIDMVEELESWAAAEGISDGALLRAVERCIETRGALSKNANSVVAVESTLLEIARLVPAPARVAGPT